MQCNKYFGFFIFFAVINNCNSQALPGTVNDPNSQALPGTVNDPNSQGLFNEFITTSPSTIQPNRKPSFDTTQKSNDAPTKNAIGSVIKNQIGTVNDPVNIGEIEKPIIVKPTQFQIYVKESTGKLLGNFGYDLFQKEFKGYEGNPAPNNYVIGPGDLLDLKVWGSVDINIRQLVDKDGRIAVPQVGIIGVSGTKIEELDNVLFKQLSRIYKNFQVSSTISKMRSVQIYSEGNANEPGTHLISGSAYLSDAVLQIGGPSSTGSMRKISLIREGKLVTTIDMYKFIRYGYVTDDVRVVGGDVILFEPARNRVALLGAIDGEGIYELLDDENIANLIDIIGEKYTLIANSKIHIERINKTLRKSKSIQEINLINPTHVQNLTLSDGDIITLPKINNEFTNAVTLKGNVARPMRYKFSEGMHISDLIPSTEALINPTFFNKSYQYQFQNLTTDNIKFTKDSLYDDLPSINWEYASIERLDRKDLSVNIIPFNLGKAVKEHDKDSDVLLAPGDVVTIYSSKDIEIPSKKQNRFIKISGEINTPGIYKIDDTDTLKSILNKAGGVTNQAYIYGLVFTRESSKKLQKENIDRTAQEAETTLASQNSTLIQNSPNPETSLALQQGIAYQKLALEKLKNIKPLGRFSLQLDPDNPVLPEVSLEDKDEIFIPRKPDFVSVFGAVFVESIYIYKPNSTVRDYMLKAGLKREADEKSLIVLHADGSIENSNTKSLSFFNNSLAEMKLYPGDSIYIPELIDRRTPYTVLTQSMKDWTQILFQMGLGVAALKVLRQ